MNQHAGLENGEDLEQEVIHIAAGFAHMRGVEKQDIVRLQPFKRVQPDILHGTADHSRVECVPVPQEFLKTIETFLEDPGLAL